MHKITTPEKITFNLANTIGTPLSLIIHTIFLLGIFTLRYLGVAIDQLILITVAAISMEAIYLTIYTQARLKKNADSLNLIRSEMDQIKNETWESEKSQRLLIYLGHQIKTMQTDLDVLKKSQSLKTSGNGHHKSAHV